jgi:hypothetical protein
MATENDDAAAGSPGPEFGGSRGRPPELRPEEQSLLEEIGRRDRSGRLVAIYAGALRVAADESNPDRLALAAHNFRELMNLLPYCIRAGWQWVEPERHALLSEKVQNFRLGVWQEHGPEEGAKPGVEDCGKLLDGARQLLEWHANEFAPFRAVLKDSLKVADPIPTALPEYVFDRRLEQWLQVRRYFISRCHHRETTTSYVEFREKALELAALVLDWISPQPVADIDEIEKLLHEYE